MLQCKRYNYSIECIKADQVANVLLLQGPFGPFFRRLARDMEADGVTVHKVNFNAGDALFFRHPNAVSYRGKEYCGECHDEQSEANLASYHRPIQCENCHGPAMDHPEEPEALAIDRSRELCLRCHSFLPYPGSQRMDIRGVDPGEHNPESECIECHNPHNPDLEQM